MISYFKFSGITCVWFITNRSPADAAAASATDAASLTATQGGGRERGAAAPFALISKSSWAASNKLNSELRSLVFAPPSVSVRHLGFLRVPL